MLVLHNALRSQALEINSAVNYLVRSLSPLHIVLVMDLMLNMIHDGCPYLQGRRGR